MRLPWGHDLAVLEIVALIARYVGAGYQSTNSSLRRAAAEPGFEIPDQVARTVEAFQQLAQPIDAGTVTYRGVVDRVIELGDLYRDQALVSSSQSGLVGDTIHGRQHTVGTFLEIRWPGDILATIINSMELEYVTAPEIVYRVVARYENVYIPSENTRITRYYVVVPELDPDYQPPPVAPPPDPTPSPFDKAIEDLQAALAGFEDFPEPDQEAALLASYQQAESVMQSLPPNYTPEVMEKLKELETLAGQAEKLLEDL